MSYEQETLIIGAGPTGLVLAIDLARRGVKVRIVDAAEGPFRGSRGKGLQPRTQEIFDLLGVMPDIARVGAPYQRLRFHFGPLSFRGASLGTHHAPSEQTPWPNLLQVPQFKTEAVLRQKLESLGVYVEYGAAFASLVAHDDHVRVTLGTGEEVRARYVVGCDGGRSAVRNALGLRLVGATVDETSLLVADVKLDGLARDDWHLWPLAKGGLFGACPLPHTDVFQVTSPLVADLSGHVERVTKAKVREVVWQSTYTPQARMVEKYRVGRVFLAGDAAHVHPPTGGQGLNTGVQDAWNLGWKLAAVLRGGEPSLLDSYEAERLPIAAAVLNLSKQLYVKNSLKRGALTNQLGLHYRGGPLSSGEATNGIQAGDRLEGPLDVLRSLNPVQLMRNGVRVLVRPDGYIANVGGPELTTFAGLPVTHR